MSLRVIDLFAGCGGITEGLRQEGSFEPVAAVEMDVSAAATYAHNFGEHIHVGDIADWVKGSLPAAEIVVGGPPCQGFSALGKRDAADPRNQMWRHYVETLQRVRPMFFVMENVPQFLRSSEYQQLVKEATPGGALEQYDLESHVLTASHCGVAQRRRRAIVIGRRRGIREVGAPKPTPEPVLSDAFPAWLQAEVTETELPQRSVAFAGTELAGPFKITELHFTRRPAELSRHRYEAIPAGGNRHDLPWDLQTPGWRKHKTGAGDVMGRLWWDRPSVTIRTEFFKPEKGRYLHPDENRPITHAEAAFIQGFPESFVWCGNKSAIARQIGNAVPPPLAKAIGGLLADRAG